MATTRATLTDQAGRTIEIQATPDYTNDPAFDSFVVLHENGTDNHTLTLVLRLYLHQAGPVPWSAADFATFKKEFLRQCAQWNNKFWLTPPAGFARFDYKVNGRTVRPNFYCHLYIDVVACAAGAHRKFDVVNLEKAEGDLEGNEYGFDAGTLHRMNRTTIAHEVGQALGLPHGGAPAGPKVTARGPDFDESSATPWLDRIALHTGTKAAEWKVSVKAKQAPKYL